MSEAQEADESKISRMKKVPKVLSVSLAVFVGLITVAFAAYYVYEHRDEIPIIKNLLTQDTADEEVDTSEDQSPPPTSQGNEPYQLQGTGIKKGETDIGILWTWKYTVTAQTCTDDPTNTEWIGTWVWDWESKGPEDNVGSDKGEGTMEFTTVEGDGSYLMDDVPVAVFIDDDSFLMSVDFQPLGIMTFEGEIDSGGEACRPE